MGLMRAFLQCADINSISNIIKNTVFIVSAVVAHAPVHSCKDVWEGLQMSSLTHGSTHSVITGWDHQVSSRQNNKIFPVCFTLHSEHAVP